MTIRDRSMREELEEEIADFLPVADDAARALDPRDPREARALATLISARRMLERTLGELAASRGAA